MKNFGDQEDPISEINVVPLVDIILVVLIIFMVTAPMFMKPAIKVNLPKASSGESQEETQLSITLGSDGRAFFNGSLATDDDIRIKSAEKLAKNPEIQAVIAADKDVPHGRVVSVMDIIKTVGVKKFAISIDKK